MIDADPLPERPGPDVDADEWSLHHRMLYRLVLGAAGASTAELQLCYEALAPVVYRGTVASACVSRRWRRELLADLRDEGVITSHPTPRGWIWTPAASVVDDGMPGEATASTEADVVGGEPSP
jgi:hypothetical protein